MAINMQTQEVFFTNGHTYGAHCDFSVCGCHIKVARNL